MTDSTTFDAQPQPEVGEAPQVRRGRKADASKLARNQRMVERHAAGETLEAIAADNDMTRERVRQIIKALGGADAQMSRDVRRQAKDESGRLAAEAFMATYGHAAQTLAHANFSRAEVAARLAVLFPALDEQFVTTTLAASGIVFDKAAGESRFSDAALMAGLWYLLGAELSLAPEPLWAATYLSTEVINDLRPALKDATVDDDDVATILGLIGAAQHHAEDNPEITLTGARYGELRRDLVEALGLVSEVGAAPWPPTLQTIVKRFGGWNEALLAMGIATAQRGRSKGLVQYSAEDYAATLSDFIADVGTDPLTYARYEEWARSQTDAGRRRPSGPAVRNLYGSWGDALRSATPMVQG